MAVCANASGIIRGLKRWDEGSWDKANKPQYSRTYSRDPLTHLALSHLFQPHDITPPPFKGEEVPQGLKVWAGLETLLVGFGA